ncbi:MAG: HsdR family type I site-specific deoxyribonuclease [Deltaproteobacteria bacterium]|nr:HsdR family type I site-specific deoxyribonuclease [Deltaproteobacteria bacterium]
MPKFNEKSLVEDFLIDELQERGWRFVPAEALEREELEEPLLIPNLTDAIRKINRGVEITDEEIQKVINTLKLTSTGLEGNRQILRFLKIGVPVKLEKSKTVARIRLIDYEDLENNEFIVTRQAVYYGKEPIRTDIMLYVNGIPLVDIECKNPASLGQTWKDAYKQIVKDYINLASELYKYVQIGVAAGEIARYFPIVPGKEEVHTYEWREENGGKGSPVRDPLLDVTYMLAPEKFLDILRNFLFFREERGEKTKVVARYMQYRAANRIVNRVLKALKGEEAKKNGLIWHWQGSGKTLTMIFAAQKLFHLMDNPSIFFIVDRIALEEQLSREFHTLDLMVQPERIDSIQTLQEILRHDNYRGKRGLFLTLIHKFRPSELEDLYRELKARSRQQEAVQTREDIVLFIDEGHRTQYGVLAAQMRAIFKNACAFAFTGTPIAVKGRDTFQEFSYPPKELYLDKYFVTDALRDGYTVKIVYQPRLERDVHLKRELLEAFLEAELEEIPENTRRAIEGELAKRLNEAKVFLENPRRIRAAAKDIAEHFLENLDGRFKGMVVAVSRKACVLFKRALDEYLPPSYSEVVMTFLHPDKPVIEEYRRELMERFPGLDPDRIRDEIIAKFKETEKPKILIVTDMLLTGFDAPTLQTMYLVKPLKGHRLLQAVARVNRPYRDVKEAGLILDYVGILKRLKQAFEMYNERDIQDALKEYSSLKEEFVLLIRELMAFFEGIPLNYERRTLLQAFERITQDKDREDEFRERYWSLRKVFELLGPDEVKMEYFEQFKWLSAIYAYYLKQAVREGEPVETSRYFEKTLKYIYRSTEVEKIQKELPVVEFDERYLKKLEMQVETLEEKVANIVFTLNRMVLVERNQTPVYMSLVDRVEKLVKDWRERTKDYERLYREGAEILHEIQRLGNRQKELGFSDMEYAVLLVLEEKLGPRDKLAAKVRELSDKIRPLLLPGWVTQSSLHKKVEQEVRSFVRKLKKDYGISLDEMNHLYDLVLERIENFGVGGSKS